MGVRLVSTLPSLVLTLQRDQLHHLRSRQVSTLPSLVLTVYEYIAPMIGVSVSTLPSLVLTLNLPESANCPGGLFQPFLVWF